MSEQGTRQQDGKRVSGPSGRRWAQKGSKMGRGGLRHVCVAAGERWLLADARLLGRETGTGEGELRNRRKRGREQGNVRAMK